MEYRQIVAITGLGGLYQLIGTKNDGAIVKSLIDKNVKFISARVHHLTPLESIEIYTTDENVRLHQVFELIQQNDEPIQTLNSKKDDQAAKAYFKSILPNYDADRVYISDIKKVLKWYAILKENELLNFDYLNQPEEDLENNTQETISSDPEIKEKETELSPKKSTTSAKKGKKSKEKENADSDESILNNEQAK